MSKLPDFEGLALFAKVAEERSYAGAARAAGVSVATVSRAVSRLEERLGGRLINRSSRRLALTALGEQVVEGAARACREAQSTEDAARDLSRQPRGTVRLAVPMSFGLRWVAPLLPDLFRLYPELAVDLHLSDATVDLVGEGFDAALRIAALPDSALVARRLRPVAALVVAAPAYLARHGRPHHPDGLRPDHCLGYAYRARRGVWHFTGPEGAEASVVPAGPLRVTNADALLPVLLDGLGVAELPDFIAAEYLGDGRLEALLPGWHLPGGALSFVTPSAQARPAKVEALAEFFAARLSRPDRTA
ncbi:LysR family transcriptional regulator [Methylobacterium currus]|uniref:LysR family transcriptional regulator n=1 Tax=Methylobacterium currus TaxID=2051553 RepID=A0A2R4WKN3_9HYPH|nr:LysR family transcriptional regulator [Methylobacterium currus]AWB22112.1 LysR family transcriptional regulator [Methylobacterium currus]UHC18263.1 LysR family transcriptional regulator [Methylobacterium currus]